MRAWTVDADDIQIADDLDVTLLHRTSWIESFLEQKRSDQFIVTANWLRACCATRPGR